ncbi:MAG TPA: hypothetical protein VJ957_11075 [Longimicrobiales bacterium]|nr:hypothetical protein [Longimicrobiales bacterium]
MGVFEFVLILVLVTSLFKVGGRLMMPVAHRLADLLGQMAADRRAHREGVASGMDPELVAELENRLARIEERLDFLEQLRAPAARERIGSGSRESAPPG